MIPFKMDIWGFFKRLYLIYWIQDEQWRKYWWQLLKIYTQIISCHDQRGNELPLEMNKFKQKLDRMFRKMF